VGSGQPTEIKTKNLGNIGLDIETDLRDLDKENSYRRIREGSGVTTPEQQQGSLARKNIVFEGNFIEEEKQFIKRKIYLNQFENKNYSIKVISLTAKKSENLFPNAQCFKVSRYGRGINT
jgi:hypothetical protein